MASNRGEGVRSRYTGGYTEDRREIVASTPAIEPRSLNYNETSSESSDTDASEYSYDTEESEYDFQGFPKQEQKREWQTETRQSSQAEANPDRNESELEWEELQITQFPGEDADTINMWERLVEESRATRIWVKKSIVEYIDQFNTFINEVDRHPDEIHREKRRTNGKLYEIEHEVDWYISRAKKFINENTEIPYKWLLDRLANTRTLVGIARYDIDSAAIAGLKPNVTVSKYDLTDIQIEHTESQLVSQEDMDRGGAPAEPFCRVLKSMLVGSGANNRLADTLMNSILNPYIYPALRDETQEAQTAHQESFQNDIEEHEKKRERERERERERKRERGERKISKKSRRSTEEIV